MSEPLLLPLYPRVGLIIIIYNNNDVHDEGPFLVQFQSEIVVWTNIDRQLVGSQSFIDLK